MAEAVMRKMIDAAGLAAQVRIDSAGTHDYQLGLAPDPGAVRAAAQRGYEMVDLRARRFSVADFYEFDLILAMDRGHLDILTRRRPPETRAEVALFLDYAPPAARPPGGEVPDPYGGEAADFEYALDLIELGARGLLATIRTSLR